MKWYQLGVKEVMHNLETSENGISSQEAKQRLSRYGLNRLEEDKKISKLEIILHQFKSPLIYILLIAGVITIILGEFIDASVIFSVVIINAIIGYIQEFKAEESVRALKKMVVPKARVIRDGKEKEINSEELVVGDIVLLNSGTRVPADIRLIHTIELKIDESMLTGESVPAEKDIHPIKEENLTPGDQLNMAFMGTAVVMGRAKGVVVATGVNTVLGGIAKEVREAGITKAPLQEKIESFAKAIGLVVIVVSLILFVIGILLGESIKNMFLIAVAASVATIPEGLPIVVTIALAVGVSRMAKQNAIIRKLPAAETLGSTAVICSDKTGTLTKNEMTVKMIYNCFHTFEVEGSGYSPKGEILLDGLPIDTKLKKSLHDLLRIGLLCNESSLYEEDGDYKIDGDPTEGALIVSAIKGGLNIEEEKAQYELIDILPFESERGYMATLHKHRGKKLVFLKGSPEKVIDMCESDYKGNKVNRKELLNIASGFAKEGMRVLAFAYKEAHPDATEVRCKDVENCDVTESLIFVGFQAMIDPPRPEVIDAIQGCKMAGIRVVMITGDHPQTALAVAKKIGIADDSSPVLTGKELETISDESLFEKVVNINVFSRVAPNHKLRITEALKKHGNIVAVTGDGVNDAPALKAAHIGIAMGKTGTDVAKEAADMILADDNFASIFNAVKEGRIVFDNIRKVTFFLIPTGIAAIISIMFAIVLNIPIPYVAAQLLWINLVTNGLQDVALAFEPGEPNIINRPPRPPDEGIMSRLLIERTILVGLLISIGVIINFYYSLKAGYSLEKARTVAVTTMVFFQFFQAWNSRSEYESVFRLGILTNPFLFVSMVAAFFAQLSFIYVPALQWLFRTEPLTFSEWAIILFVSSTVILVVEVDKFIRRKKRRF